MLAVMSVKSGLRSYGGLHFDDLYSPEYILQGIFEKLQMCNLDFETAMLLKEGHDEIMQTECYQEYGYPSYI